MRLPVLAAALTWTPGRRLQHTQQDMAPAWSSRVRWQPENAPASPSPAPRPRWLHRQPLCWGLRPLCPGCFPHAPPAAAHVSYISSVKRCTQGERRDSKGEKEERQHFIEAVGLCGWTNNEELQVLGCWWIKWKAVHQDPTSASSSPSMLLWGAQRGPPSW